TMKIASAAGSRFIVNGRSILAAPLSGESIRRPTAATHDRPMAIPPMRAVGSAWCLRLALGKSTRPLHCDQRLTSGVRTRHDRNDTVARKMIEYIQPQGAGNNGLASDRGLFRPGANVRLQGLFGAADRRLRRDRRQS